MTIDIDPRCCQNLFVAVIRQAVHDLLNRDDFNSVDAERFFMGPWYEVVAELAGIEEPFLFRERLFHLKLNRTRVKRTGGLRHEKRSK